MGRICVSISPAILWYAVPLFPLATRGLVALVFRDAMQQHVHDPVGIRQTNRSLILALAGFSFAGLLGIAVADAALEKDLRFSLYYLLVSFLFYFFALDIQRFLLWQWIHQSSEALIEAASLSLLLSVVSAVLATKGVTTYAIGITVVALAGFALNHTVHLFLTIRGLRRESPK